MEKKTKREKSNATQQAIERDAQPDNNNNLLRIKTGYVQHTSPSKLHVASKVPRRETRNEEEGFRVFLE